MKTLDEHTISSAVREVMPRYDITEAYLFDSYARNEADEESDVDICIECGDSITLFSLGGPGVALESALGSLRGCRVRQQFLPPRALNSAT